MSLVNSKLARIKKPFFQRTPGLEKDGQQWRQKQTKKETKKIV